MIKINDQHSISVNDLSDLMVAAFEGGINYWCRRVKIVEPEKWENMFASDIIANNGRLILFDAEVPKSYMLTLDNVIKGIKKTMDWGDFKSIEQLMNEHDAETADVLIQFAIFDEITYG